MRTACFFMVLGLAACGRDPGHDPDAQQLARINKELATLTARVAALTKRLDRLEQEPQPGEPTLTDSQPNAPAAEPRPALPTGPMLTVGVTEDAFLLGGSEVSEDELAAALREHAAQHADAKLIIHVGQAGASVPHARVMEIIDIAKKNGISSFSLAQGALPTPPTPQPTPQPASSARDNAPG